MITFHDNTLCKHCIHNVGDITDASSPGLEYFSVDSTEHASIENSDDDIWRQVFSISPFLYTLLGLIATCVTVLLCSLFPCKLCATASASIHWLFKCCTAGQRVGRDVTTSLFWVKRQEAADDSLLLLLCFQACGRRRLMARCCCCCVFRHAAGGG